MSNLLVTPILFQYRFLDDLCSKAAKLLSLDLSDDFRYYQFKLSIMLNFNRYLLDSMLFLPDEEAESLLADLVPAMQMENETKTLAILKANLEFFDELTNDFLNIIKTLKK
jgi:hypothetical protein